MHLLQLQDLKIIQRDFALGDGAFKHKDAAESVRAWIETGQG